MFFSRAPNAYAWSKLFHRFCGCMPRVVVLSLFQRLTGFLGLFLAPSVLTIFSFPAEEVHPSIMMLWPDLWNSLKQDFSQLWPSTCLFVWDYASHESWYGFSSCLTYHSLLFFPPLGATSSVHGVLCCVLSVTLRHQNPVHSCSSLRIAQCLALKSQFDTVG